MIETMLVVCALAATPVAVLGGAVVGRSSPDLASRFAASLATVGWISALCLAVLHVMAPTSVGAPAVTLPGLTIDWLALLMLMLVLGLSALIQFFAVRYLRGDPRQVWFVTTANLVTAATALMVCAASVKPKKSRYKWVC